MLPPDHPVPKQNLLTENTYLPELFIFTIDIYPVLYVRQ